MTAWCWVTPGPPTLLGSHRRRSTPVLSTCGTQWPGPARYWRRARTAGPIQCRAGSPEPRSELESHQDGIPDLTVGPAVVAPFPALFFETKLAVQGDTSVVVGPDLQVHLVGSGLPGSVDGHFQQGGPDALA